MPNLGWLICLMLMHCTLMYATSAQAMPPENQPNGKWRHAWWLASQSPQQKAPQWLVGNAQTAPANVPLGSLWKLIVYSYSIDQNLPDKPYECHIGTNSVAGDEYCCTKNETLYRDVALARSCGAYFEPTRLQLNAAQWQQYWQKQTPDIVWLHSLNNIKPQTQASVPELLNLLNHMSRTSIDKSRQALLGRILQPQWSAILPNLGGAYRFKTFTWQHPQYLGAYFGGGAGWLADGTAFWLGGTGASREVILKAAPTLAQHLTTKGYYAAAFEDACVAVHYFKRYPIERVQTENKQPAPAGTLNGLFIIRFNNGNSLKIKSNGELTLSNQHQQWHIWGRLEQQEYLARVVDREANANITEAAKALSIAARSYLYQNAKFHQGCWQIDDDSHTQRVSPNPASNAAKSVVAFTEGLSLIGSPIYFHANKSGTNVLSWQAATQQASNGDHYLTILHQAYPKATWQLGQQEQQCKLIPNAEAYLQQNLSALQTMAQRITGLERVQGIKICKLDYGNPYADADSMSIYIRDWRNENDRITLWHEYLHLALRFHPSGRNEQYIETLARKLANTLPNTQVAKRIRHAN